MTATLIVLCLVPVAFVIGAVTFGLLAYFHEDTTDYTPTIDHQAPTGWWADNDVHIEIVPDHKGIREEIWAGIDGLEASTKWALPEYDFDHDAVQLAADRSCQIEPEAAK